MARKDIIESKEKIENWVKENRSKAFMCRELKCKPDTLNSYLIKIEIEYKGNQGGKGVRVSKYRKSALEYLKSDGYIKSNKLKKKLIEDGVKEKKCEECKNDTWNGKEMPLELHHVDGDRYNNSLVNLQILCPNCHAQTPNNSGKNVGGYD